MTSWRTWTARVPDPVLGARSAGARARLLAVAGGVLLAAADVFVQAPLVRGVFTGLHLAPDRLATGLAVISVFAIAAATTMRATALTEVLGPRRQALTALVGWSVGAAVAGGADAPGQLCTGRAIQGAAAGLLVPTGLAMARAWWPPVRAGRPRALVLGAVVLAPAAGTWVATSLRLWSSWRTVLLWDVALGLALAWLLVSRDDPRDRHDRPRLDRSGALLVWAGLGVGLLLAMHRGNHGSLFRPTALGVAPLVLVLVALAVAAVWRDLHGPADRRRVLGLREFVARDGIPVLSALAVRGVAGGLLVAGLGGLRSPTVGWAGIRPWLAVCAGTAVLLGCSVTVRSRRAPGRGAFGAVVAGLAGAALAAAVVYVPLFNLATRHPRVAAAGAWVDLRMTMAFVIAVLIGGVLLRLGSWVVAAIGFLGALVGLVAMSHWGAGALRGHACWLPLLAVGGGLGLAAVPVATLRTEGTPRSGPVDLAAGLPDWLLGIAVGLPLLTARGLAVFRARMHGVLPPAALCPASPGQCAQYERAVRAAVLDQYRAVFVGAALCAALAATLVVLSALPRAGQGATGQA